MRLDKFLKVSRLVKRRTLAKEVADQGRVTIQFGHKVVTIKIESINETVKKEEAKNLYTILKEEQRTDL